MLRLNPCWLRLNNTIYRAKKARHPNDVPMIASEPEPNDVIFDHGFTLTKSNKVPMRVARRACSIPAVPWKLKDHGDDCDCIPDGESD